MGRKRKYEFTEEDKKRIEEEVKEQIRKERIIEAHKARIEVISDILERVITRSRYDLIRLDNKFIFELYRYFINNSDLTDSEKDRIDYNFVNDYLFIGRTGIPEGTDLIEITNKMRESLKKYRES